jgi:hypothetical protein
MRMRPGVVSPIAMHEERDFTRVDGVEGSNVAAARRRRPRGLGVGRAAAASALP